MKHLIIDTEQEAILRQAVAGVTAFLMARATRRDPLGLISKAYRLQERKCSNLSFQLDQDPIATYQQLPVDRQADFEKLLTQFLEQKSAPARAVLYTHIHAFIMAQRHKPEGRKRITEKLQGEISQ